MINSLRLICTISHLSYSSRTIPLIQKYQEPMLPTSAASSFTLLNFQNRANAPTLLSRLFKPKPHAELLQLYLNFIENGEYKPKDIAYPSIQENLRKKIMQELIQKRMKISVNRFKVLQSELIEETAFRGVFIHRNFNLNSSAYDIKPLKNGSVSFQLKKSMRSQVVQEYERTLRAFSSEKMEDIYCKGYDQFQRDNQIKRSIFKMIADISIIVNKDGKEQVLNDGPTEHLLQVQSVFNKYYNLQEFFLTDVDFLLKGNYFLRTKFS